MSNDLEIINSILLSVLDDYTELWIFVAEVEEYEKGNSSFIKDKTIKIIGEMLDKQLIKAGESNGKGEFAEWKMPSIEIIKKIKDEWDRLDRKPNIGDNIWFDLTEKGEKKARKLLQLSDLQVGLNGE